MRRRKLEERVREKLIPLLLFFFEYADTDTDIVSDPAGFDRTVINTDLIVCTFADLIDAIDTYSLSPLPLPLSLPFSLSPSLPPLPLYLFTPAQMNSNRLCACGVCVRLEHRSAS